MKFTNIKQLIIKFMGGGIINFPTRFLRWVKIEGNIDGSDDGGDGGGGSGGDDEIVDAFSLFPNPPLKLIGYIDNSSWDAIDDNNNNITTDIIKKEDLYDYFANLPNDSYIYLWPIYEYDEEFVNKYPQLIIRDDNYYGIRFPSIIYCTTKKIQSTGFKQSLRLQGHMDTGEYRIVYKDGESYFLGVYDGGE